MHKIVALFNFINAEDEAFKIFTLKININA
jgi:hypothetical protein